MANTTTFYCMHIFPASLEGSKQSGTFSIKSEVVKDPESPRGFRRHALDLSAPLERPETIGNTLAFNLKEMKRDVNNRLSRLASQPCIAVFREWKEIGEGNGEFQNTCLIAIAGYLKSVRGMTVTVEPCIVSGMTMLFDVDDGNSVDPFHKDLFADGVVGAAIPPRCGDLTSLAIDPPELGDTPPMTF